MVPKAEALWMATASYYGRDAFAVSNWICHSNDKIAKNKMLKQHATNKIKQTLWLNSFLVATFSDSVCDGDDTIVQ